jgi:type I site-specific restriction endonuclease
VLENNNITSYGRIRVSEDDTLHSQSLIQNIDINDVFDDLTLDTNDVYKQFRVRGYDYGPKFRGIQQVKYEKLNKIYGKIKWTGDWISFMDSVIQLMSIAMPFKNIFVPIILTTLRCDPKVFFDAIEESKQMIYDENNPGPETDLESRVEQFDKEVVKDLRSDIGKEEQEEMDEMKKIMEPDIKQFEQLFETGMPGKEKFISILPVFADLHLKSIITCGIELNNVIAAPIPRKLISQEVKCESYQFIPNEENNAIEEMSKNDFISYIEVIYFYLI